MSDILACMIMEEDTGRPLYTHFIDKELERNPSSIAQKIRSRETTMIHEMSTSGLNLVFSLLVLRDEPELRQVLKQFRTKVERVYHDGMKAGGGTFADYLILQDIVASTFIERED
jgi:hypothetical protein